MSLKDEEWESHESFGTLNLGRATYVWGTGGRQLFGSSIRHTQVMTLTIQGAKLSRHLNNDWILPDSSRPLIEVDMSLSQFAEAITTPNKGEGTPVTIRSVLGKPVREASLRNKRVQFDEEFEQAMKDVVSDTNEYQTVIAKILDKPNIGKGDREEIKRQLGFLVRQISSTVPFIKQQFTEQMDRTVVEAKSEVEAFIDGKLKSLGAGGFRKELEQVRATGLAALEDKKETA